MKTGDNRLYHSVWTVALLLLLTGVLILNAWVVDDAYITFRTVDNFVQGRGLTWNPGERVQVYTHPLWMFVVALCYLVTSEFFFTVIGLSVILTLLAVLIVRAATLRGSPQAHWKEPLLVAALIASKALIDYASSGLENALSYLIAAVFLVKFMSLRHKSSAEHGAAVGVLFFLATLAFINRFDTILLYFPALLYLLWCSRATPKWRLIGNVLLAVSPAILWMLFAILYYGSPFPNTAYAKSFSTGYPSSWKMLRGLEYLGNSVLWDTSSYFLLGGSVWLAIKERTRHSLAVCGGMGLYFAFTVLSAASATHMSGRFFALPFFIAIVLLVTLLPNRRTGLLMGLLLAAYIAVHPLSAVKFGTPFYRPLTQHASYIDAKWYVAQEGAALLNWRPGKQMPDHSWYHEGSRLQELGPSVHIGGAFGKEAIGYVGLAAGPEVYIIDIVGLGDPLLARLPAIQPEKMQDWKSGHFRRAIPAGYVASVENDRNLIENEDLRQYYEAIRTLTRGPLFSWPRFQVIWNMNLGRYDHLVQRYAEQVTPVDAVEPGR